MLGGVHAQRLACPLAPRLELTMAPLGEVVHVLEELVPGHDTWSGIWRHEARARALGVGTDLLAHVLASTGELVLDLRTALLLLCNASLLLALCQRHVLNTLLDQGLGRCSPGLELTVAPLGEVVHVLEELVPSHDTWNGIWRHEARASALRVCANLLAHVFASTCELVLKLSAVLE